MRGVAVWNARSQQGSTRDEAQIIFLGLDELPGLGEGVFFAEVVTKTVFVDLSAYPRWLVVFVGTLVAVLVIWIMMKLLKWTLWLLLFAVLIGGVAWAGYLLLQ
jgi:hypothetical protein